MQVSHTLLSLINSRTGQPFSESHKRLTIFGMMLHSGVPQSLNLMVQSQLLHHSSAHVFTKDTSGIIFSSIGY